MRAGRRCCDLTDDILTIDRQLRKGGIYENIRKSILFRFSNLGTFLTMFAAVAIGMAPLEPGILDLTDADRFLRWHSHGWKRLGRTDASGPPRRRIESLFGRRRVVCAVIYGCLSCHAGAFFSRARSFCGHRREYTLLPWGCRSSSMVIACSVYGSAFSRSLEKIH